MTELEKWDWFFKSPLVSWTTDNNRKPEAKTIGAWLWNALFERQVDGILSTVKWYVLDVLHPLASAGKNVLQWTGWIVLKSQRWENGRLKNLGIAAGATVVDFTTAVKNLAFWVTWAVDNIYRKNVQDATSELAAGTIDRIPWVGQALGNLMRLSVMIPWVIPRTLNMLTKAADTPFTALQNSSRLPGRKAYTPSLRWGKAYYRV